MRVFFVMIASFTYMAVCGHANCQPKDGFAADWKIPSLSDKIIDGTTKGFAFDLEETDPAGGVTLKGLGLSGDESVTCFSCSKPSTNSDVRNLKGSDAGTHILDGTYIIMKSPSVSEEDFFSVIQDFDLKASTIGSGDLYLATESIPDSARSALPEYMNKRAIEFSHNPAILAASPDTVTPLFSLQKGSSDGLNHTASLTTTLRISSDPNRDSYGDIEAASLWALIPPSTKFRLGMFDQGFSAHEDIDFEGLKEAEDEGNHGNSVAGLACAKHGNNIGIDGVLPNCLVVIPNSAFVPASASNENERFTQQIANLYKMITDHPDVKTFSVSLGHSIPREILSDPSSAFSDEFRRTIALQANFAIVILRQAENNGQTIFFAAGNDSSSFAVVPASFGSPFNFASIVLQPKDSSGLASGVVVQAHSAGGGRWERSNGGAHISCPGVDLFSAMARDDAGVRRKDAYGRDSGTSMATPLCAAAFEGARKLANPANLADFRKCVLHSGSLVSETAVPRMQLSKVLTTCH